MRVKTCFRNGKIVSTRCMRESKVPIYFLERYSSAPLLHFSAYLAAAASRLSSDVVTNNVRLGFIR